MPQASAPGECPRVGAPGGDATRAGREQGQIFNSLWLGKNPLSHPKGIRYLGNNYDDDYDDDAYTDTKAVLMMLSAIMIIGMNDGVNIEGPRNPEFASISPVACNFPYP